MIPGQTDADPQDAPQPGDPAMSGLLDQPRAPGEPDAAGPGGAARPPLRRRWALLVSLAAGLLLAAAFPPVGLWPLAFVSPALLLNLRWWPLAVAGWWVAAEAFRDRWPWGGFPWGRLAMSQAGVPTQGWAGIAGPPALTFVVALIGACLGWLLLTAFTGGRGTPRRHRLLLPALAL